MKTLLPALYIRLLHAFQGYILWHNIIHLHKVSGDCAVILVPPSEQDEYARYAVKHLNAFFRHNYFKSAIFLFDRSELGAMLTEYGVNEKVQDVIYLSERKIKQLLAFCNANLNDGRLIIASLDIPYGRNMLDYLKTGVLSKEEIFLIGVYNVTEGIELGRLEDK